MNPNDEDYDFLEHYGVPGMQWGVRRSRAQLAKAKSRSEDSATVKDIKKKKRSGGKKSLTNKELQTANTRKNLERQYDGLNPSVVKKGENIAKTIIAVGATANTAIALAKSPVGKSVAERLIKNR